MARQITIVCGPTSAGKSDYVFKKAQDFTPSLIISADSRQFYQGVAVLSGQDNLDALPSSCLLVGQGFLSPDQSFSISQFKSYFLNQLKIFPNYKVFVVGGSGLYLKVITENLDTLDIPPNMDLRQKLDKLPLSSLQKMLQELDPKKFNNLNNSDLNNPRRLIRALEVATSNKKKPPSKQSNNLEFNWIGIKSNLENLETKIRDRVVNRLANGAISEVEALLREYQDLSLPIYSTLGVREIIDFLNNKYDLKTLIQNWTTSELQYAKRQMTWFRKQPQIVWYDKGI